MASKVIRNIASLGRDPKMVGEYLGWMISSAATGGKPTRKLLDGIEISGFTNFSEYHSVPGFINQVERRFFETAPVGDGPIIDIGANVGLVSLLLARRFPDRVIHAFEPNPSTFEALTGNIGRNAAHKVVCHQLAVSDADGTVLFDNDPIKRGTASISTGGIHAVKVPAITLDSFVSKHGIDTIGLLKVDVEGYETMVFGGAAHVINTIRPASIYFEVCPPLTEQAGFPADGPAKTLMEAGYDLFRFTDGGDLVPAVPADVAGIILENWLAKDTRR
jgi:FkbM family methyltransferase